MNLDTFTWFAVFLVTGLAALAVTVHVLATDEGLTTIRTRLRHRTTKRATGCTAGRTTPTLEGNDDAHHSD